MNSNPSDSNEKKQSVDIMSFNKEKLNLINNDFNRKEKGLVINKSYIKRTHL